MPDSPYLIQGPALISFSGGRTSAYMLWKILQAHGGVLPEHVYVVFANTGRELPETLAFVQAVGQRWGVHIHWVEWCPNGTHYGHFVEVGSNSASRDGEPFAALIKHKGMPPNWQARFCTEFLKVRAMMAFMLATTSLAPGQFKEVIGLRQDEMPRIFRMIERNEKEGRKCVAPLAGRGARDPDGVDVAEVLEFWLGPTKRLATSSMPQGFDLGLEPWEGNCDICFLKSRKLKKHLIRKRPQIVGWWIKVEEGVKGFFDRRDQYRALSQEVRGQPDLFMEDFGEEDYDVECGLLCGAGDE
jgi:hypothetical protein